MSPATIEAARLACAKAASSSLSMFRKFRGQFERADLEQIGITAVLAECGRYNATKSAWPSWCYGLARSRLIDVLRRQRLSEHQRGDDDRLPVPTVDAPGEPTVIRLRDRPYKGRRGRPWKLGATARVDIARRRTRGETLGSIAMRYGVSRQYVADVCKSVRKIADAEKLAEMLDSE
jgi:hypothetical protein